MIRADRPHHHPSIEAFGEEERSGTRLAAVRIDDSQQPAPQEVIE